MHEPSLLLALSGLAVIVLLATLAWALSVFRHDVSIIDSFWPVFIASAAVTYALRAPAISPRAWLMLTLLLIWALRLSAYIAWRNHGQPEDRRYQQIRARNQPYFAFKSLYLIFGFQTLLAWVVSTPLLAGLLNTAPLNVIDLAGAQLAAAGIVFEAVADQQMARFKSDPMQRGQVLDRGLWRYTRHPNYFGECCVWWGLFLLALAGGVAWSVVSPLLMTLLLLKVSGVTLLEADIHERRPAYRDYIARTNAFVPGPRRDRS